MVRLVYSNRTEELLSELAAGVREQQLRDSVLSPVRIVVPSASIETYVKLGVARQCGIAANLQTTWMTGFAAETIAEATGARVAGADAFEAMALTVLLDESMLADPALDPVRAFLGAGPSRDAFEARCVQLAARVGRLFEEYAHSRPEMLAAWSRAPSVVGPHTEAEGWQRHLWLAMFGEKGLASARGLTPLHEAVASLSTAGLDPARPVHVFGFAHFARTFHDLLRALARAGQVVVYCLSPCEGFWEDFDARDPPALTLWGRPGREHVRALNATAGFDHEDRFVEPEGRSLLAQFQRDLLRRLPARDAPDPARSFEGDRSIVFLEHASIRRELEAVASEIWRLLEGDSALCFDDIAVVIPDMDADAYLAHLPAVFRESHGIAWQRLDVPGPGEDGSAEAIELLLALPFGRFSRQELLRLAVHPAVVASVDGADPERWLAWCDSLGIVHGADHLDHEDTYIEHDILNWDQGLRRLALGAFMGGDRSGDRRPFEVGSEAYVPLEIAPAEVDAAVAFGLLVRSLIADARFMRASELSLRDWATFLATLVETYVTPANDADAERIVGCMRRLLAMGEMDVGDRPVSYRVAYEMARRRIRSPDRGRGGEGVVVSRVAAVRSIPFRVLFACGMGEGRYPSSVAEDPLDLRWARRREGDVTTRDRDKYAFLEMLLGTRERLVLSHVSRDPLTGDPLAPSSVVQELARALARGYIADVSSLRRRHPLRRWAPEYFPDLFPSEPAHPTLGSMHLPEARAEARTLALRRDLDAHGAPVDRTLVETAAASDPSWAALADHLRIHRLPDSPRLSETRVQVPMYAIVSFLDFPLQGWARYRIGLDEVEDEDVLAREDEPLETEARDETLLLRGVLLASPGTDSIERAYDDIVRERELRAQGPSGVFAHAERALHLRAIHQWSERLAALDVPLDGIEVHRFGRAGEQATAQRAHSAVTVDVDLADAAGVTRIVQAEIGGRTLPMGGRAVLGSITLRRRPKDGKDPWARADRERATLRAFVDHAVLSASGVTDGRPHASVLVVATPDRAVAERVVFEPLSRGEALVWLRGLVRELLGGPHAYFFPSEAILRWQFESEDGSLAKCLESAREALRDGEGAPFLRSAYGPVGRLHEYPIPEEPKAREMVEQRFGALFKKRRGAE